MLFLVTKSFQVASSVSRLILMTTSGWPANSCTISFMCGSASLQGPHQVAQKSISTTLPARLSIEMGVLLDATTLKLGAMRLRASSGCFEKSLARVY